TELLLRVDELLRDQGSPKERIALYRAVLARGDVDNKRALLRRIGAIEQHDLGDAAAAIETYCAALDDDADDADAEAALRDLYAQCERWDDLCALLERRLVRLPSDAARTTRATLATVAAAHGHEMRARTQCARLLEDPGLAAEHLEAVGEVAQVLQDADMERAALLRRAEIASDGREQMVWLERLAELDEQRRGDKDAAASAWKRAASLADGAGEEEAARRLYWRAHRVAPGDTDVTTRLVALSERTGSWEDLPSLYASLGEQSTSDAERVDLLLRAAQVLSERLGDAEGAARRAASAFELAPTRADVLSSFESLSVAAGAIGAFERAIDRTLARFEPTHGGQREQRTALMLSRARVLALDPRRVDDAANAYRAILDDAGVDPAHFVGVLAALERLVASDPESPQRRADHQWVLGWRAEHASEDERVVRLLDWARAEETTYADPSRALVLYRRARDVDPDSDEALSAVTRTALATGDIEEALSALRARRARSVGPMRIAIDLEIAQVLVSRTTRWPEALAGLRAVLTELPNDSGARALAVQLLTIAQRAPTQSDCSSRRAMRRTTRRRARRFSTVCSTRPRMQTTPVRGAGGSSGSASCNEPAAIRKPHWALACAPRESFPTSSRYGTRPRAWRASSRVPRKWRRSTKRSSRAR
ncbi:MAG: hypothetical protein M3O46_00820, partial [Myxococcota bacterium]|nr:hypothetical protein [Myxococcota bacterium]